MNKHDIWIVGEVRPEHLNNNGWSFVGVFNSKVLADRAAITCKKNFPTNQYFIGPTLLNTVEPYGISFDWMDAYYVEL